ncbi:GntR family transcriptional regulator [Micromonospora zhanjiangensis]|uniref:GntR family transcriptional regulator n=1 Tax=Micromonospora zhanjiangensis TaxID=1522057 RepID=A0ABV8KFI0_9ACTN
MDVTGPIDWRPLYVQLADTIAEQIERGDLAPGQVIPSEPYLMGTYNMSRGTVRAGLRLLRERGLIVTQPGKGSFVVEPKR